MNNPSDDAPTNKVPSDSPVGIEGERGELVNVRNMLLVVLAFTSGFIDAISFLGLAVFASVMTGNTVLLGLALGTGNVPLGLGALLALVGYIGGVALGARIVDPDYHSTKDMAECSYKGLRYRSSGVIDVSNWGIFRWKQTQRSCLVHSRCIRLDSNGSTERSR